MAWWGEESEKQNEKNFVTWDKDTLLEEKNLCTQAKQKKEFIHYFPSAGRCSAASWTAELPHAQQLLDKCHNCECPFSSSASQVFNIIRYGISLWSVTVSCPGCPLPNSCPPPAYSLDSTMRNADGLDAVWALHSNSWNTGVLLMLILSQIQNTASYCPLWRKLTPSKPQYTNEYLNGSFRSP